MSLDSELGVWQRRWQTEERASETVSAANLRRRVERESRRMRIGLLAPLAVTVGIGGGMLLRAVDTLQNPEIVLAIGVWAYILVAWIGALWIAHGTWRPLGETTAAFVDLSIRRLHSGVRAAKLGAALYVAQLVFVILWKLEYSSLGVAAVLTAWPTVVIGWIGFPLFLVWLAWYLRAKRAELEILLDLRAQITGAR